MSHLDEGTLHALLDGEIPSAELAPIQAHLSACPECRARLEAERELMEEADGLVDLVEVPVGAESLPRATRSGLSRGGWLRGLGWAASVIGAAGLGYLVRDGRSPRSETDVLAVAPNPPAPAAPAESGGPPADPALDRAETTIPPQGKAAPERRPVAPSPRTSDDRLASGRVRDTVIGLAADSDRTADSAAKATEYRRANPSGVTSAPLTANRQEVGTVGRFDQSRAREAQGVAGAAAPEAAGGRLALAAGSEPVTFPEALRRLDGSLRLIPGMVPIRLEVQGAAVRVVYSTPRGELVLSQQLRNGQIVFTLEAPPGFPADSLDRLRARVRE